MPMHPVLLVVDDLPIVSGLNQLLSLTAPPDLERNGYAPAAP